MLVRTQDAPQRLVTTLTDEVEIDVAEGGEEAVGIVDYLGLTAVGDLEAVVGDFG